MAPTRSPNRRPFFAPLSLDPRYDEEAWRSSTMLRTAPTDFEDGLLLSVASR
jgi:hypothetical protein